MYFSSPSHLAAGTRVRAATYSFLSLPLGPFPSLSFFFRIYIPYLFSHFVVSLISYVVSLVISFRPYLSSAFLISFLIQFYIFIFILLSTFSRPRFDFFSRAFSLSLHSSFFILLVLLLCLSLHHLSCMYALLHFFALAFSSFCLLPSTQKYIDNIKKVRSTFPAFHYHTDPPLSLSTVLAVFLLYAALFVLRYVLCFFFSLFLSNLKKGRQSGRVLVRQQQMFSARLFSLRMRMPVCLYMFVQTCTCFMPQKEEDGGVLVHEYVCFISMSVCEF